MTEVDPKPNPEPEPKPMPPELGDPVIEPQPYPKPPYKPPPAKETLKCPACGVIIELSRLKDGVVECEKCKWKKVKGVVVNLGALKLWDDSSKVFVGPHHPR